MPEGGDANEQKQVERAAEPVPESHGDEGPEPDEPKALAGGCSRRFPPSGDEGEEDAAGNQELHAVLVRGADSAEADVGREQGDEDRRIEPGPAAEEALAE